jgi:hypothetical protein
MVGGSLHRSCSSAYRRVTGKGGSSKGKAKKRRARQEEEEHDAGGAGPGERATPGRGLRAGG